MTRLTSPLVPLAVAFGTGIAVASWLTPRAWCLAWLAAAAVGLAGVAARRHGLATAALLIAVLTLGALRGLPAPLPSDDVARLALPRLARVEGRIAAEPSRVARDVQRLLLDVDTLDGMPRSGRVQLTLHGDPGPLAEGQRIALDVKLRRASGFRNPLGFDYAAVLARAGIQVVGSAASDGLQALDSATSPWPVRVKRASVVAIESTLPPVSAALLAGLLLGDRSALPGEILDAFRRSGVYHVLAVSGFNVAILASALFVFMRLVRAPLRLAAVTAIAVVIAFAMVVGAQPSVLRAVVMAVVVLGALLLGRDAYVVNNLALAVLAILVIRPGDLFDPGFQLSFAATAGIVLAPMPKGLVFGALAVSLAAELAVLPITLSHFNQVSTIGAVANLGVVPLAGVATVLGLVAVAGSFLSETLGAALFNAVWPVLLALRALVFVTAAAPSALIHLPAPPALAIGSYVGALLVGLLAWRFRERHPRRARHGAVIAAVLGLSACALAAWPMLTPGNGRLRVTILDVGQGDAIVVEMPDRRTILVDAGPGGPGRLDTGERVVAPFLWNHGILKLAGALVTHSHADHAGGMAAVRRLFRIDEDFAGSSARRSFAGVVVSRLTPVMTTRAARRAENDEAIVIRLDYGLASVLLASDASADAEDALLLAGRDVGATVLKVGHHGSRSSSSAPFLSAVHPAIAIVSVGARNAYGHPDPGALDRLRAVGAAVYRTDRDGAVIVETDGRILTVTRWASRRTDRYCLDPESIC